MNPIGSIIAVYAAPNWWWQLPLVDPGDLWDKHQAAILVEVKKAGITVTQRRAPRR
jgi:hypothetical protein